MYGILSSQNNLNKRSVCICLVLMTDGDAVRFAVVRPARATAAIAAAAPPVPPDQPDRKDLKVPWDSQEFRVRLARPVPQELPGLQEDLPARLVRLDQPAPPVRKGRWVLRDPLDRQALMARWVQQARRALPE